MKYNCAIIIMDFDIKVFEIKIINEDNLRNCRARRETCRGFDNRDMLF